MTKFLDDCGKLLDAMQLYLPSAYGGFQNRKKFENLKIYCDFIGHSRSGHTLIGALLNAHPNIAIADELGVLKYAYLGFSRHQIYYLILKYSQLDLQRMRNISGYAYQIPNQWQGRVKNLQVVGDKDGQGTTIRLSISPLYLRRLYSILDIEVKFIHVVRNPYDNISTITKRRKDLKGELNNGINHYFSLCEIIANFKKTLNSNQLFELKHESFIENPKTHLQELCNFLGVEADDDYLNDCASIVYKSPHKSRHDFPWNKELIEIVKNKIDEFPFLQGYSYEN